jgi:transcriptional regulator with XRE-family HTH domain
MATRERPADRGRRVARTDLARAGSEIRVARQARGGSQRDMARRAGLSASQIGRIERGELRGGGLDALFALAAVVGLDARLRLYPGPDPALDAAQLRRVGMLRELLPASTTMRTEVPLPIEADQRAWDALIEGLVDVGLGTQLPVDIESRLVDVQAQRRRLALKLRDSPHEAVLLVLADTRHNRDVIRAEAGVLALDFPVGARACLRALREGRHPGGSSIILL